MITDILIKSCEKDVEWLKFSLRSIQRFCTGFRDVVLLFPEAEKNALKPLNLTTEKIHLTRDKPDFYLWQQLEKVRAYKYSDADFFTYVDSDVVFTRPCSTDDLFYEGKPIILYTPYSSLVKQDGTPDTPWRPVTEAALKRTVEHEFMRRHVMTASRDLLISFCCNMERIHGKPILKYIMSQPNGAFSEFNALFAFSFYEEPHRCHFVCTEPGPIPPPFVKQFWSWGGITPEIRNEMEKILA